MRVLRGAWTALVTPFTVDGADIDVDRLIHNIERQADAGLHGIVPCGTTGETPTLDEAEYRTVVETAIETGRRTGLAVMAGAGSNSTEHAVAQHRFAAAAGADAALHVTPYYNRPSPEGLYRHFSTIANAADLPVVLYNVPGRTGVRLDIGTIDRLAAHPNIAGIKDATGGLDAVLTLGTRDDLVVLCGDDPLTLPMAAVGARGVISVLGNVAPARVAALWAAIEAGRLEEARAEHIRNLPLARALLQLDVNPVPAKTALARLGLDTGAVRLPLCAAPAAVARRLDELLVELGLRPDITVTL